MGNSSIVFWKLLFRLFRLYLMKICGAAEEFYQQKSITKSSHLVTSGLIFA